MQLQHDVGRERNVFITRMNRLQNVAVSGDFLFGTVARRRLLRDDLFDSLNRSNDAFDAIARFGALHNCRLP